EGEGLVAEREALPRAVRPERDELSEHERHREGLGDARATRHLDGLEAERLMAESTVLQVPRHREDAEQHGPYGAVAVSDGVERILEELRSFVMGIVFEGARQVVADGGPKEGGTIRQRPRVLRRLLEQLACPGIVPGAARRGGGVEPELEPAGAGGGGPPQPRPWPPAGGPGVAGRR